MSGLKIASLIHDAHSATAQFRQKLALPDPSEGKTIGHVAAYRLSFFVDTSIFQHREHREDVADAFGMRRITLGIQIPRRPFSGSQFFHKLRREQLEGNSRTQRMRFVF